MLIIDIPTDNLACLGRNLLLCKSFTYLFCADEVSWQLYRDFAFSYIQCDFAESSLYCTRLFKFYEFKTSFAHWTLVNFT